MATLSIKNFPNALHAKLKEQAKCEHRSMAQVVIDILERALDHEKAISITGLRGLGKELWEGIDAAEYIREERDSWDS
jgi:plasmid stability protein